MLNFKKLKVNEMKGKDTTVAELLEALQKCNPDAIVRIGVSHDLDVELVKRGPIVNLRKPNRNLVILDCCDDSSHGFDKNCFLKGQ